MKKYGFYRSVGALIAAALLTMATYGAAAGQMEEEQDAPVTARVPVLMYHAVTKDQSRHGKFAVSPQELEADLQYLQNQGYTTLVMEDLIDFVQQGSALPDKPVLLTFDDGNYSDYLYVWPLLQKYHMRAVLSIIGQPTDQYSREGRTDIHYPQLTWPQIRDMLDSGAVEIQNHSYDMHGPVGALKRKNESQQAYEHRFCQDVAKMQTLVRTHLGLIPTTFAFPLGRISDGTGQCLRMLGFCASLSCTEGINVIRQGQPDSLFLLKRVNRPHGLSAQEILKKIL